MCVGVEGGVGVGVGCVCGSGVCVWEWGGVCDSWGFQDSCSSIVKGFLSSFVIIMSGCVSFPSICL